MGRPKVFKGLMVTGLPATVTAHWLKLGPFWDHPSGFTTVSTTVTPFAVTDPAELQTMIVIGILVPFSA